MFTPSITAFDMRNLKRQRDHTIILIAHFRPNRSFPELTFLHRVSVAFFNIHHFREEKKKLRKYYIKIDLSALGSRCYQFLSIRVSGSFKDITVCIL